MATQADGVRSAVSSTPAEDSSRQNKQDTTSSFLKLLTSSDTESSYSTSTHSQKSIDDIFSQNGHDTSQFGDDTHQPEDDAPRPENDAPQPERSQPVLKPPSRYMVRKTAHHSKERGQRTVTFTLRTKNKSCSAGTAPRKRPCRRRGYANFNVMTHDDMLSKKLEELRDILTLDVVEGQRVRKHSGTQPVWPPTNTKRQQRLTSTVKSAQQYSSAVRNHRQSAENTESPRGISPRSFASKAGCGALEPRKDTKKVQFDILLHGVELPLSDNIHDARKPNGDVSLAGCADDLTPLSSGISIADDANGGRHKQSFPSPRGLQLSVGDNAEWHGGVTAAGKHDAAIVVAPSKAKIRRDSNLRCTTNKDVRLWLRKKESVIKKLKRLERDEEKQKEQALIEEEKKKKDRMQLAKAAMSSWLRDKFKGTGATLKHKLQNQKLSANITNAMHSAHIPSVNTSAEKKLAAPSDASATKPAAKLTASEEDRSRTIGSDQPAQKMEAKTHEAPKTGTNQNEPVREKHVAQQRIPASDEHLNLGFKSPKTSAVEHSVEKKSPIKIEHAASRSERLTTNRPIANSSNQEASQRRATPTGSFIKEEKPVPVTGQASKFPRSPTQPRPPGAAVGCQRRIHRTYIRPMQANDSSEVADVQLIGISQEEMDRRKSYNEWLRGKMLSDSGSKKATETSYVQRSQDAADKIPSEVIREAARRRLERVAQRKRPMSASGNVGTAQALNDLASALPGKQAPFTWKTVTTTLLPGCVRSNAPKLGDFARYTGGSAHNGPTASRVQAVFRQPRYSAKSPRTAEQQQTAGGFDGAKSSENPFRVPFPRLQRPRSALERNSFKGPMFASFVHKLLEDEERPDPQGSDTPDLVTEEKLEIKRNIVIGQAETLSQNTSLRKEILSRSTSKAEAPDVCESNDIFALTSVDLIRN